MHLMSTHSAYFWRTPLPEKQEIPEKTWWWCHHHVFSGISCFLGSGVHQKYTVWYSLDAESNSTSNELSRLKFEYKHKEIYQKYEQKNRFFMIAIPKFILKNCLRGAPFLNFKEFWLDNTWWHGICIIFGRPILNWNFL